MKRREETLGVWQYFMLIISIVALILLAVQTFTGSNQQITGTLQIVDHLICGIFFLDFLWQLYSTKPRRKYLKWGWLDLVASIPMFPALRIARLARIIRIVRILRGVKASKSILKVILLNRAKSTFGAVVFGSFVLLLFSTIAIVNFEPSLHPREAIWWCLFTLITGEYGDFYPASTEGRIITALLMTAGVAVFGTFTATVASFFLEEDQQEDENRDILIMEKIDNLSNEITNLKKQIEGNKTNG
jgi:voltage-gated potassium channel